MSSLDPINYQLNTGKWNDTNVNENITQKDVWLFDTKGILQHYVINIEKGEKSEVNKKIVKVEKALKESGQYEYIAKKLDVSGIKLESVPGIKYKPGDLHDKYAAKTAEILNRDDSNIEYDSYDSSSESEEEIESDSEDAEIDSQDSDSRNSPPSSPDTENPSTP